MVTLEEEGAELFKRFLDWLKRYLAEPPAPPPPPPVGVVPHILDGPKDAVLGPGGFATFTVLSEGTPPLAYQWFGNGTAIPGAISPTFSVSHSDALRFVGVGTAKLKVTVTNRFGVDSREAVITIQPEKEEPPPPPPPPPDDDEPPPPNNPECPRPDGIKLGFRQNPRKLALGWRNEADVTSLINGGDVASPSCGPTYFSLYGEPEAQQDLDTPDGWKNHPVERASIVSAYGCILRFSTNSEDQWKDGRFIYAGPMRVRVTWPWLNYWREQKVTMTADGKLIGGDNSHSYDKPK